MNFENPKINKLLTPVDYFNFFGTFADIFDNDKRCVSFSDTTATYLNTSNEAIKSPTFILEEASGLIEVKRSNPFDNLIVGTKVSKFMVLTAVRFKNDICSAINFVEFSIMRREVPFIRVGTDYFKTIKKTDRYGTENTLLKAWKKDEIKQDHGKDIFNIIPKYNDFTIIPNNKTFIPTENGAYNLYNQFPHKAVNETVQIEDIQTTVKLINHIFGEQAQLGLKYMQILYLYPTQILPILALVSTERETGKTTFLNWLQMIFGQNSILINPNDLTSSFNDTYALKNIVMIDETVIDKAHTIEKLKSIATAKTMSVSQKFVSSYSVPFFGKVVVCTNKETDFIKIDREEIRFWVRKIKSITEKRNTNIENDLRDEIPLFLKYLEQLPAPDFSRSRMVFTQDEIQTDSLEIVKEESKSGLYKDLELYIERYFYQNETIEEFFATPIDIKEEFFIHNNQISANYIRKVLKEEFKMKPNDVMNYSKFAKSQANDSNGRAYKFKRSDFITHYKPKNNVVTEQLSDLKQFNGKIDI